MIEAYSTQDQSQTGLQQSHIKSTVVTAVKKPIYNRYFIELHVPEDREASRIIMNENRCHAALEFIKVLREWVTNDDLLKELSSVSVTAMGQVMIVCSNRLIDLIREQDIWAISHIRSAELSGDLRRISGKV